MRHRVPRVEMQTTLNILETVLLVLAILVAFAVLAAVVVALLRLLRTKRTAKKHADSGLEITHLDKQLAERVQEVKRSVLPEKERKKLPKKQDRQYDSTVFVIDFHPSLRAHEVHTLREEIDIITQLATPRDEVVVRIDSAGGTVNGFGHAASQLLRVREAGVPLTICVDEVAASGGYMCAAVADKIIAAPFAYIGSIGVVAGMPNFVGLMNKVGVRYLELTAGENKRTLTPFSDPTPQKEAIELERLEAIHTAFKNLIKQRRPNLDIDKVADGNYWLAVDAKELGLVDIIETSDEYLSRQAKANRRILKISCKPEKQGLLEKLLDAIQ
ncbi:MAG: protease SohB [Acidobacteriaceae bacterium]|nr:protease SohB [Acidobacteriaceae bacterium]MBV8572134.1 protease SohB [Acidobacteriaceae bacterium]